MNIETGREFSFTNPQDDPDLYPRPPPGFSYDLEGRLRATPGFINGPNSRGPTGVQGGPSFPVFGGIDSSHPGIRCNLCQSGINRGVRYKCLDCADFDLCEECEKVGHQRHGGGLHVFAKIYDSRRVDANSYLRRQNNVVPHPWRFGGEPMAPNIRPTRSGGNAFDSQKDGK